VDNRVFKSINKNYSWDKKHRLALVFFFFFKSRQQGHLQWQLAGLWKENPRGKPNQF
jgi:hypothetical protein